MEIKATIRKNAGTPVAAVVFAMLIVTGPSIAATVLSDDFGDGNRNGWHLYGVDEFTSLMVSGGALKLTDTVKMDSSFAAVGTFPAADLSRLGSRIMLELDFQNLEDHTVNRGIGIGLYSSQGTQITSDGPHRGPGGDDSGWFLYVRRNPFLHRLCENNGKGILETASVASRVNDNDRANIRLDKDPSGFSVFGIADGIWHSFKMEIEAVLGRDGQVDHRIKIVVDQGRPTESVMTHQDGGGLVTSYDQVVLISMKGNDFMVDNVKVTYDD